MDSYIPILYHVLNHTISWTEFAVVLFSTFQRYRDALRLHCFFSTFATFETISVKEN